MQPSPELALPQGHSRRDVIALISEIGPNLGLSGAGIWVLTKIIGSTDDAAWTDPNKEPIFYGRQETMAERLHMTTRQLRNHERNFIKLKLMQRRTLANGGRDYRTNLGLVLNPLIQRFFEFIDLREKARAKAHRMKDMKALRSVRLREVKDQLARLSAADIASPAIQDIMARRDAWPRTDRLLGMSEDALAQHIEDTRTLCVELEDWIENQSDSSCEPASNFRSFIQEDTQEILSVTCNANDNKRSAGKPAHDQFIESEPNGPDHCREKKRAAETAALQGLLEGDYGLRHIVTLATEDFQIALSAHSDRRLESAVVEAAAARIAPLGINISAWDAACNRMGRIGAAVCVLVLDANRDHPTSPVRNPGGALRGMVKQFNRGKLNIIGSLIGLHRRRGF
ncbi:replication initiation protein RepC [Parasulfitobacter algicola]|uniref:Replication protein-C C-terminal domain-containing protein n=1 Tax=Parasulfitobacter algicola TaxID=2614809 RepID=A0ABX2IZX9_9RHOB|nr:replication initiation protein RepC [Sulfitobacter algicola]NSX56887.1 hypothetical protein [Sulfitobacter algicola]